jgi:D-glycero-D-manno-heptose 1,7-bisphosphate phosphatase
LGERPIETVFLDRDGTLNVKAPEGGYVSRPDQVTLLPRAADALARLNRVGLRTVLVTNQRWLSRPGAVLDDYPATHARVIALLAARGARLDAAYHCPHDRGACDCRKPAPGMLIGAASDLGFDLGRSMIIGDALSDLAAGRAAGTGTMLISRSLSGHPDADVVVPDLHAGVELLLGPGSG